MWRSHEIGGTPDFIFGYQLWAMSPELLLRVFQEHMTSGSSNWIWQAIALSLKWATTAVVKYALQRPTVASGESRSLMQRLKISRDHPRHSEAPRSARRRSLRPCAPIPCAVRTTPKIWCFPPTTSTKALGTDLDGEESRSQWKCAPRTLSGCHMLSPVDESATKANMAWQSARYKLFGSPKLSSTEGSADLARASRAQRSCASSSACNGIGSRAGGAEDGTTSL